MQFFLPHSVYLDEENYEEEVKLIVGVLLLVQRSGQLYQMPLFRLCYGLACTLFEIFLPLLLLTVCNVCLIRALRRSYRMQVIIATGVTLR